MDAIHSQPNELARICPTSIVRSGLRLIHDNLRYFDPLIQCKISEDLRHQALAELSLLCLLVKRYEAFDSMAEMTAAMNLVARLYDSAFFQTILYRWNDALVSYLILTVSLEKHGYEVSQQKSIVQEMVLRSNLCSIERTPYRLLELRHILDIGGFAHSLPSYRDLWRRTLLAQRPNLVFLSDSDVYAITHTLFYLSDFSWTDVDCLSPQDVEYAHYAIAHLLGVYVRRKHCDLVAACTRFRRHRVRCFDGAGGGSWRDGSLRESSSSRLFA